jgi:protein-tyrosine phosphatase
MLYAASFGLLSLVLVSSASEGEWRVLLAWPALACAQVSAGYCGLGPRCLGKRADGTLSPLLAAIGLPYLALTWALWHGLRRIKRERPFDELLPNVWIGRRLLPSEFPAGIEVVVDLTCEFAEPLSVRSVPLYLSFPILDAAPAKPTELASLAVRLAAINTPMYIHCAEGHGRTGMVAALLLLARRSAASPEQALDLVQSKRPGVRVSRAQRRVLSEAAGLLECEAVAVVRP